MVTLGNPVQGARTQSIDPLGNVVAAGRRHVNQLVRGAIDLASDGLWGRIAPDRRWREQARQGDIYRGCRGDRRRSHNRTSL